MLQKITLLTWQEKGLERHLPIIKSHLWEETNQ